MDGRRLPVELCQRLEHQLGGLGLKEYLNSLDESSFSGVRINTLKTTVDKMKARLSFLQEEIPWTKDGFYYDDQQRPAKHPFYQAGLYYLQEPSAMAPAALLQVKPGERVLDLCAAPGGKSTQLASALQGQGLLVSNDNSPKRVKSLVWNLEHWGVTNGLVFQEEPSRLAVNFEAFFDKILVDAPCSGEGMFRKDPKAMAGWVAFNGQRCRMMQEEILEAAAKMLRPGGRIMYSTCTFNPLENEEVIQWFLSKHKEYEPVELPLFEGWQKGRDIRASRQIWPQYVKGEGHFLCLFEKRSEAPLAQKKRMVASSRLLQKNEGLDTFSKEYLEHGPLGPFMLFQDHLYQVDPDLPSLDGLKTVRPGWYLGRLSHGRFEPSQAFAMGLTIGHMKQHLSLAADDPLVSRYLRGETLMLEGPKGWTLVCLEDYPLGFGKQTGDYLKNHYPPGWRQGY